MPESREIAVGTKDTKFNFTIRQPYEEGQVISAIEAHVLNQTRRENIGNQIRTEVQKTIAGEEKAMSEADLRSWVAERDESYEFSIASTGGGSRTQTPLEKEAKRLATMIFASKIKEAGFANRKAYEAQNGEGSAAAKIASFAETDKVQKLAKKNVKEMESLAEAELEEAA